MINLFAIFLSFLYPFAPQTTFQGPVNIKGPVSLGGGSTAIPWVSTYSVGSARNDFTGCLGHAFTVSGSPLTIKSIGRWVISGNSGTHNLSLYSFVSGSTWTQVANGQVTVNTSGATAGQFLYGTLSTPPTLSSSTQYLLLSEETNAGDQWYNDNGTTTTTAAASNDYAAYANGSCASSITVFGDLSNKMYVPTNFKY